MSDRTQQAAQFVGLVLDGTYRIVRLIGEGGMGSVYEATQIRLGKRVAVKIMARDLASNQEALARFRREAEITSQLGHPHIVNVTDFGTAPGGEPYLAMEFLQGEDLDHRLHRIGHFLAGPTVNIVKQITSALAATHAKGIVHRDLKPGNVFLMEIEGESDFVKVVDFGISKVKAASMKLTRASVVMGTPNYMSPEQATGRVDEIDARTDQWALACIAWEMLSGRSPFVAEDVASLLYQVVHANPPPLAVKVVGLPKEVENVLRKALAKKATDRFANVTEMSRALEAAVDARPPGLPSGPRNETLAYAPTKTTAEQNDTVYTPTPFDSTVFAGLEAPNPVPRTTERQVTTFSRSSGEIAGPMKRLTLMFKRKPRWALAAGGGAVGVGAVGVVAAVLMVGRPSGSAKSTEPARVIGAASATARPPALPVPKIVPQPPVVLQQPPVSPPATPGAEEEAPLPRKKRVAAKLDFQHALDGDFAPVPKQKRAKGDAQSADGSRRTSPNAPESRTVAPGATQPQRSPFAAPPPPKSSKRQIIREL